MAVKIYAGSVKDIWQTVPATEKRFGQGYMRYEGDPFSVFDYGEMPWQIEGKGEILCKESGVFFNVLEDAGIPTHFREDRNTREIGIHLARMLDYDKIVPGETIIYRIPIECVFTKVVTPVSSLHGRLRSGRANLEDYGLDHVPERDEVIVLPDIRTSYSTKIETTDVYKSLEEMTELAGLVGNEAERLDQLTRACAEALIADATKIGLFLADGKFEFIMGPGRNLIVGDTGYTWDENRFLYHLPDESYVDMSKQLPRNIYTIMGWRDELKAAQKQYPNDKAQWPAPPEIGDELRELCTMACMTTGRAITEGPPFVQHISSYELEATALAAKKALEDLKSRYGRDETGKPIYSI
ncbi:MAG: hypothetical protein HZB66_02160 [Candidatus Aenigmarchaeota archaeon]|nr:hypothetical protein [Candidatus Aenigmarchaeota archaeon]